MSAGFIRAGFLFGLRRRGCDGEAPRPARARSRRRATLGKVSGRVDILGFTLGQDAARLPAAAPTRVVTHLAESRHSTGK